MKDAEKILPRVIHSSLFIVMTLFLLANLAYFAVLEKSVVKQSNTVALDFGRALFGPLGAVVFSAIVAISCFGALNAGSFISARLVQVASREKWLPSVFEKDNEATKTPVNAMALHAALTISYIVAGSGLRSLMNFYSVASWSFYLLTVLGLLILRIREPEHKRPYKTYITTPLIFSVVALFLLCMPIIAAPLEALAALGFVLAGIPIYYVTQRVNSSGIGGEETQRLISRISREHEV